MLECLEKVIKPQKCIGVDLSEEALAPVRQRFSAISHFEFKVGSINRLPFEDNCLELITCTEVLEHLFPEVFYAGLKEIARVLRPGGYFLATLPVEEKLNLVVCPNCSSVYAPYQHMIFEISREDISRELALGGMEAIAFYDPIDRTLPANPIKRVLKNLIIKIRPALGSRLFPRAGARGFLAVKVPEL